MIEIFTTWSQNTNRQGYILKQISIWFSIFILFFWGGGGKILCKFSPGPFLDNFTTKKIRNMSAVRTILDKI